MRVPDANGVGTVINDPDPVYDDCSNNSNLIGMTGQTNRIGSRSARLRAVLRNED
ncbi:hypothetical protein SRABI83_03888 [Arthrobacter sp. Bi83]|uniref:hypothetical protein n=1 Tax=Arthrobacter sp. Bi83 TaxID=2822353 RepID=UPI001D66EB6D|nr:hypothetical protein [Arthrobacter sp. Bi83]CAH0279757.1 hypothetical protein SRABI83_03888 [Arthrobacter sp. Bi83]